jgi:hypothetical protein
MSVLPIGLTGPMSKKMFPQATPVNTNYVDLAMADPYGNPQNERVAYYQKKGIGKVVPVSGAAGMGSGISHTVYRVPKSELLTRNQVRKIYKNEENAMMAAQAAERAAAAAVRQGEMNANVAGIVYTDEPTSSVDIDKSINLESLANKGFQLAAKKKWNSINSREKQTRYGNPSIMKLGNGTQKTRYGSMRNRKEINVRPGFSAGEEIMIKENKVSIDDAIEALRSAFIEVEKGKVYHSSHLQAEAKAPKNSYGKIHREFYGRIPIERDRLVQEHIDRKIPKIEAVLAKVREGMILGFPAPAPKVEEKEENLLRFNNLSSINFSAQPSAASTTKYMDPFAGLNTNTNITHKNFTNAGIEIEKETVNHLSKNQRKELLSQLTAMNKSEQNSAINTYLATHPIGRRGGERKTRKSKKSKKTRKIRR